MSWNGQQDPRLLTRSMDISRVTIIWRNSICYHDLMTFYEMHCWLQDRNRLQDPIVMHTCIFRIHKCLENCNWQQDPRLPTGSMHIFRVFRRNSVCQQDPLTQLSAWVMHWYVCRKYDSLQEPCLPTRIQWISSRSMDVWRKTRSFNRINNCIPEPRMSTKTMTVSMNHDYLQDLLISRGGLWLHVACWLWDFCSKESLIS
jgi:hypothetical protein